MTEIGSGGTEIKQGVFIVEDDPAIAEALRDLFDSAGIQSRSYASAEEFIESLTSKMPGCVLLDVRLPGMSGMELHAHLLETGMDLPVIVMTAHGDVPMVRKAFKAGAIEFLTKPFQDEELLKAVEQAFNLNLERSKKTQNVETTRTRIESLSDRERQIVELVAAGLTNRDIAMQLYLSIATIKLYRRSAMDKMGADSLAELVTMWNAR